MAARRLAEGVLPHAVGGQPLDPARTYRLAVNDFLASGGDGYAVLTGLRRLVDQAGGPNLTTVVIEHVKARGRVAPRVDGVLLAVRIAKNTRPNAERAKEILTSMDANVLGVVVNGVDREANYGAEYGYGYGYGPTEGGYYEGSQPQRRRKERRTILQRVGGWLGGE